MKRPSFSPFPLLATDRLLLRQLIKEDLAVVHAMRSDPINNVYLGRDLPQSVSTTEAFIADRMAGVKSGTDISWAIVTKSTELVVGTICLWNFDDEAGTGELGYELVASQTGQGFMTEAVQTVVDYGLDHLALKSIRAYTDAKNCASRKVLERTGFVFQNYKIEGQEPQSQTIMAVYHVIRF